MTTSNDIDTLLGLTKSRYESLLKLKGNCDIVVRRWADKFVVMGGCTNKVRQYISAQEKVYPWEPGFDEIQIEPEHLDNFIRRVTATVSVALLDFFTVGKDSRFIRIVTIPKQNMITAHDAIREHMANPQRFPKATPSLEDLFGDDPPPMPANPEVVPSLEDLFGDGETTQVVKRTRGRPKKDQPVVEANAWD